MGQKKTIDFRAIVPLIIKFYEKNSIKLSSQFLWTMYIMAELGFGVAKFLYFFGYSLIQQAKENSISLLIF